MPAITPFLWFDSQAEEAMNFYLSIFKRSKVIDVSRAGDRVMTVTFEVEGQRIIALNGGPVYKLNEAFSLFVGCETQQEIDELWDKLLAGGGAEIRCGWLTDRYGLTWQIIPNALGRFLSGSDGARTKRVVDVMMTMQKLDLQRLQQAYDGA